MTIEQWFTDDAKSSENSPVFTSEKNSLGTSEGFQCVLISNYYCNHIREQDASSAPAGDISLHSDYVQIPHQHWRGQPITGRLADLQELWQNKAFFKPQRDNRMRRWAFSNGNTQPQCCRGQMCTTSCYAPHLGRNQDQGNWVTEEIQRGPRTGHWWCSEETDQERPQWAFLSQRRATGHPSHSHTGEWAHKMDLQLLLFTTASISLTLSISSNPDN